MEETLLHLSDLLFDEVKQGNKSLGALVIVGTATGPIDGTTKSMSGGNTAPIVAGLVKEMRRSPAILSAVRMALTIIEEDFAQQN